MLDGTLMAELKKQEKSVNKIEYANNSQYQTA